MAIVPEEQFVGKITPASPAYPLGQARDITVPNDGTGTPLRASLVNDLFGFQQALLKEAGITPNGVPDTALDSQYLQAIKVLFPELSKIVLTEATKPDTGELKLPIAGKELRLKYGRSEMVAAGNSANTLLFETAFPVKCVLVVPYTVTSVGSGAGAQQMAQLIGSPTKSSFQWFCDALQDSGTKAIACGYIALGY